MRKSLVLAVLLGAGIASAGGDPELARLESALPAGWSMLVTDTELVIRHDRPVYVDTEHGKPATSAGPLITLELRYRLEPKWTPQQVADARGRNAKVTEELRALRARYRIDAIRTAHGQPQPTDADERNRLTSFGAAEAPVRARLVPVPLCTLGGSSVFDGDDTYAQLGLAVDPADAMREATKIVGLVKTLCGAK